jgi:hypothetical protein
MRGAWLAVTRAVEKVVRKVAMRVVSKAA